MKPITILGILRYLTPLSILLFIAIQFAGCSPGVTTTQTEESEDYLSALNGLTVTTTFYHDEVFPPPPGMKYPPTFYEPILIGSRPPNITGSVTIAAYGQPKDEVSIEPDWYREGQTLDILIEANKAVLWQKEEPNAVAIYATFGGSSIGSGYSGLSEFWGFFYEGTITETQVQGSTTPERRYSTALRVISWEDGNLKLDFWNFSTDEVKVTYSIWEGGFVSDFNAEYMGAWEEYWEANEVRQEEFLRMKDEMEKYLRERW